MIDSFLSIVHSPAMVAYTGALVILFTCYILLKVEDYRQAHMQQD